jgi:4-amino-4-deoxy-L-arabinose transferase-like glycosyltransferase
VSVAATTALGRRRATRGLRAGAPRGVVAFGLLLALALLVRLAFLAATPDYRPDHDDRNYDWLARSVALTGAYPKVDSAHGPRPTSFRPPGYPYALGGVYRVTGTADAPDPERWLTARRVQAVLGTVTVGLLGLLGWSLLGRTVGLLAMGLAALYPPLLLVEGALISEGLFVAFVLGAVLAAVRHRRSRHALRWAVLAGALAGLATLTRTNAPVLLLPLALAVWTARPRLSARALAAPAALVAAAALCVVPWTVRNWVVTGELIPLATQTGPALAGTFNEAARLDRKDPWAWRLLRNTPDYRDVFERRAELSETEIDRITRARVGDYLADHPEYVVEAGWWNLRRLLELAGTERARIAAGTIGAEPAHADLGRGARGGPSAP